MARSSLRAPPRARSCTRFQDLERSDLEALVSVRHLFAMADCLADWSPAAPMRSVGRRSRERPDARGLVDSIVIQPCACFAPQSIPNLA
jgi:hypothetical protein